MMIKRGSLSLVVVFQVWLNLQLVCGLSTPQLVGQSLTPKVKKQHDAATQVREKIDRPPPGSPVNLFMPDEFQFYTLNGNGELVMKQMTKQEIQGMLAASGDGLEIGQHHQTQLPQSSDEAKVSDVVQNVQNVVQSELNKSSPILQGVTSIPNSINDQWANMLPHLLSGGLSGALDQDGSILLPTNEDVETEVINMIPVQPAKPASPNYGSTTSYVKVKPSMSEPVYGSKKPTKYGTTSSSTTYSSSTAPYTTNRPYNKKPGTSPRPVTGTYIKKSTPTTPTTTSKPYYVYEKLSTTQQTFGSKYPSSSSYNNFGYNYNKKNSSSYSGQPTW